MLLWLGPGSAGGAGVGGAARLGSLPLLPFLPTPSSVFLCASANCEGVCVCVCPANPSSSAGGKMNSPAKGQSLPHKQPGPGRIFWLRLWGWGEVTSHGTRDANAPVWTPVCCNLLYDLEQITLPLRASVSPIEKSNIDPHLRACCKD